MTAPQSAPATQPDPAAASRRRWLTVGAGIVVTALLVGAFMGFLYLFLRPAAPPAVGATDGSPTPAAGSQTAATPASSESADPATPGSINGGSTAGGALDGTWTVDPSLGSFSDFSGSFVGYRVQEELASIGAATAVGRTPNVTGSVTLDGTTVSAADFTADLTTLQSDDDRRDGQLRRQALETATYPTATFTLTQPIELSAAPADGEAVSATATGDLTIHGVTNSVSIPIEARLAGDVVTVTGSTEIVFADYGMSSPQSFIVLSIADRGTMEFQLQLTKG
ncbi:MAG TPA: YceI family protein [Candidatus Limnocylindrales bacterium]|nr:YceI family protein [Candidatus Limnocylindrales bacterium]